MPKTFSEFTLTRANIDDIASESTKLMARWNAAETTQERVCVIEHWDQLRRGYSTESSLAYIRFTQDTQDEQRKDDKQYFDTIHPDITEHEVKFMRAVVESEHRADVSEHLGEHVLNLWDCTLATFDPVIADDQREESKLRTEYTALLAAIRIPFNGTDYTMSTVRGLFGDADRNIRLGSLRALSQAMGEKREELDNLYDQLVAIRNKMATKLGYSRYTELGYKEMLRTDYSADDVTTFREMVRRDIVPIAAKIRQQHAKTLGVSDYGFHDESVRDSLGVPKPKGDHDWMLDQASAMFAEMGSDFSSFFEMMRSRELLDLKSRDGKAGGGYCSSLTDHGIPFIFANFNGTQDDVNVFTHECGHAFQCHSSRGQRLQDYLWPTYEACEIHSMSLEMLTYPHMEKFFGDDAARFRTGHLEGAILFLPYGCAVDEFQHLVYDSPTASPEDRAEMWQECERRYMPWRVYNDMPHFASGRYWQRQGHIYSRPFYYIDYCLAQVCALQFWDLGRRDRPAAMSKYRQLCNMGGSLPFTQILDSVGLQSPFQPQVIAQMVDNLKSGLAL